MLNCVKPAVLKVFPRWAVFGESRRLQRGGHPGCKIDKTRDGFRAQATRILAVLLTLRSDYQ